MRYPWVNLLLLLLLAAQLATGFFGFTNGRQEFRWILWLHGIGAYALVVLIYWKSSVVLDALRRKRVWTVQRIAFAVTTILLLMTLAAGLFWTFGGPRYLAGFSLVSLHIYLAIPLTLLLAWHGWHMRFIFRVREARNRRSWLRGAATAVAGLVVWRAAEGGMEILRLPGSKRRFTGSFERGSFSGVFPSVSWIADKPAPINLDQWELTISGEVERPLTLAYHQLAAMVSEDRMVTLDCTGGWYTTQFWRGIGVDRLLDMAGIKEGARSATFTAVSGYQRRFSLDEAAGFLVATHVAGAPLSHGHGFPLRLVAPGQRGVNWVKWVNHVTLNKGSSLWQAPLPLR